MSSGVSGSTYKEVQKLLEVYSDRFITQWPLEQVVFTERLALSTIIIIIIITYIYNVLNDALSASRINKKLKTILSKYIHIQKNSPSVRTILPIYNH